MILVVGGFGWDSMACLYYSVFFICSSSLSSGLDWIGSMLSLISFSFLLSISFSLDCLLVLYYVYSNCLMFILFTLNDLR